MFSWDIFILETLKQLAAQGINVFKAMGTITFEGGAFNVLGFVAPLLIGKAIGDIADIHVKRWKEKKDKVDTQVEKQIVKAKKNYKVGR